MSEYTFSSDFGRPAEYEVEVDLEIYNNRVLYVFKKTINRVKLASLLVTANEDTKEIWEKLSEEVKSTINLIRNKTMKSEKSCATDDDSFSLDIGLQMKNNETELELSKVMLLLENDNNLKDFVANENFQMTETFNLFEKCLQELSISVECHQKENPVQEKQREKNLKRFQLKNEQTEKEIASLEEELIAKKSDLNANLIAKNLLIHRYETKQLKIKKVTQEAIRKRISESESEMKATVDANDELKTALNLDAEKGKMKYELLLQDHLIKEKDLRVQRTKLENQLAAWMQKFDQDMFERQGEEEKLQAAYEAEKKKMDEIQRKLDEQEEEYDELMQEKAAYEQEVLEQKLFVFILNRSARRIQRAFRAYKLHKMTKKKKGKKGKGKKK